MKLLQGDNGRISTGGEVDILQIFSPEFYQHPDSPLIENWHAFALDISNIKTDDYETSVAKITEGRDPGKISNDVDSVDDIIIPDFLGS